MNPDIEQILSAIPDEVRWEEVVQFEHLDGRVLIANAVYGDVVGVSKAFMALGSTTRSWSSDCLQSAN